jgi:hypothetical protein
MAREAYSRDDLKTAWTLTCRVEFCLFFGGEELDKRKNVLTELDRILEQALSSGI